MTSFPYLFRIGDTFWNTTDMFCTDINMNIKNGGLGREVFEEIRSPSNFVLFSRSKFSDDKWEIVIYDQQESRAKNL